MATASMRALAAHDEREEIRGPDYLAELFITEEMKAPLKDLKVRQWVLKNKVIPGAYEFMIARTAFFDNVVRDAFLQNLAQVVLLGAGYDSRPYRFYKLIQGTRIFELDAQPTQLRKQTLLEQAGIQIPDRLKFVPIDFNHENLKDVLQAAGLSSDQRTLFVWEGVTHYLTAKVVDDVLRAVRDITCAGSSICFDYASISAEKLNEEGVQKLRERMKSDHPAEPTKFGIPQGTLVSFLAKRGYAVIEHLSSVEMEKRYLSLSDGSSAGKVPALFSFVHASLA